MDGSEATRVPSDVERRRPTPREAFEAAKAALAAQGLEMTLFGLATNERIIAGAVSEEEAEALIFAYYRARTTET